MADTSAAAAPRSGLKKLAKVANPQIAGVATDVRPFLRWAGSKRKLLAHLLPLVPPTWKSYHEPFLGGGSLFLYLGPTSATLSDACSSLISTYIAVRDNCEEIIAELSHLTPDRPTFEYFKALRPTSPVQTAVRFILLNKACWNGLYRVNSKGEFNVPFGRPKTNFLIDRDNFRRAADLLRRPAISISNDDFKSTERHADSGDFVFLDPPYVTRHNGNGFVDWNESIFSWLDQEYLAAMARRLASNGINVLVTNANHPDVIDLYRGFGTREFSRSSTLASNPAKRERTTEALFYAGPHYI